MRQIKFVASGYGSWPMAKPNPAKLKPADLEKLIQSEIEKRLPLEVDKALIRKQKEDELNERRAGWRAKGEAAYQERVAREAMERFEREKADIEAKLDAWDKANPGHNVFEVLLKGNPIETASATPLPKWYKATPD
jgi:hypothetical protein